MQEHYQRRLQQHGNFRILILGQKLQRLMMALLNLKVYHLVQQSSLWILILALELWSRQGVLRWRFLQVRTHSVSVDSFPGDNSSCTIHPSHLWLFARKVQQRVPAWLLSVPFRHKGSNQWSWLQLFCVVSWYGRTRERCVGYTEAYFCTGLPLGTTYSLGWQAWCWFGLHNLENPWVRAFLLGPMVLLLQLIMKRQPVCMYTCTFVLVRENRGGSVYVPRNNESFFLCDLQKY